MKPPEPRWTAALIFAVAVETVGGLLWAGRAAERLDSIELRLSEQQPVAERLARLETRLEDLHQQLNRIEGRMERAGGRAQ